MEFVLLATYSFPYLNSHEAYQSGVYYASTRVLYTLIFLERGAQHEAKVWNVQQMAFTKMNE